MSVSFYHQWRLLLGQEENNPNNLCLNGEPCKHISPKAGWKYPDLILHHSQADNVDNRIACEFKRKRWTEAGFDKDMQTLHLMLTGAAKDDKLTKTLNGVFLYKSEVTLKILRIM